MGRFYTNLPIEVIKIIIKVLPEREGLMLVQSFSNLIKEESKKPSEFDKRM